MHISEKRKRGVPLYYASLFFLTVVVIGAMFMLFPPNAAENTPGSEAITFEISPSAPNFSVFQEGEELVYEVSYLTFKLGAIIAKVIDVDTVRGIIKTECLMKTYRGVPFVTLHTMFQSTVNDSLASISFSTKERISDTLNKYIHYSFPTNDNVVHITERIGNKLLAEKNETLKLDRKRWQDGLSLLFYARANAHRKYVDRVPVLVYNSKATTTIRFGDQEDETEIDAVDYPIRSRKIDGETGFTGVFGLTGNFEGWFSADEASVPLYAKMHVIIGSVRLELIKWKRKGWNPPRMKRK